MENEIGNTIEQNSNSRIQEYSNFLSDSIYNEKPAWNGKKQKEQVISLKSSSLLIMMIFVKRPKNSVHDIFMSKPGNCFHKSECCKCDKNVN